MLGAHTVAPALMHMKVRTTTYLLSCPRRILALVSSSNILACKAATARVRSQECVAGCEAATCITSPHSGGGGRRATAATDLGRVVLLCSGALERRVQRAPRPILVVAFVRLRRVRILRTASSFTGQLAQLCADTICNVHATCY